MTKLCTRSVQESHRPVGVGPEESHKNSQRAGAPFLSRKAEGAGVILEKIQIKPCCSLSIYKGIKKMD